LASGNVIKAIPRIVWPTGNGAARRRWPGDGQEIREQELEPEINQGLELIPDSGYLSVLLWLLCARFFMVLVLWTCPKSI